MYTNVPEDKTVLINFASPRKKFASLNLWFQPCLVQEYTLTNPPKWLPHLPINVSVSESGPLITVLSVKPR